MTAQQRTCKPGRVIASCLFLAAMTMASPSHADSLRSQLGELARANGIVIEGLDILGPEPSRTVGGDAAQQIKSLLSDYNFLLVGQGARIERLTITSRKQLVRRPATSGAVKTLRVGAHHQIRAILSGPSHTDVEVDLLVDTGATMLVLPESMMAPLGMVPEKLRAGVSQTAGGSIPVKIGVLGSVKVGDAIAENVPVSFIADQKLNGARLLGMSFLNRFRFSLDDENSELLLTPKR